MGMFTVLVPAALVFLFLAFIGISRPRKMKLSTWCWIYIAIALSFDFFATLAVILNSEQLMEILVGVAAGSATSLAYHVWKDMKEIGEEHDHHLVGKTGG